MKTIVITEEQEQKIFQKLINESISDGDVRMVVVKFLNNNFLKTSKSVIDDNGQLNYENMVIWVDKNKEPIKTMNLEELFWLLQDKFQNLKSDKKERDIFIWETLKAWYSNKLNLKTGNIV